MSPEPGRYPNPLINMSPTGLPGLYVVLVVVYGFITLSVSRDVAEVLLQLVIGVALLATVISVVMAIKNHGS